MRRALSLAVGLALARAAVAAEAGTEALAESVVELRVNGQPETTTLVVRRDVDGTLLVQATDLAALRVRKPSRGAVIVNGERYYRVGSEIGAQVTFDAATQSVDMVLPARAFLQTRGAPARPDAPRASSSVGAFVNYDAAVQTASRGSSAGGLFELGLFGAPGVVTHTAVARREPGRTGMTRLDTAWTRDFPDRLATLRVGDSISSPGAWGRSVRFGGLQFGTNFSTQPSLVTAPLLSASGEAVVPSTVDVFVNGRQVASEVVPPGPFDIGQLPAINGAGQMQVVVTDTLGRQQVLTQPYYSATALLRRGLAEYSVELGAIRHDYARASSSYGALVGAVTYRRGLTDRFTGEVHAAALVHGPATVGLDVAWQAGMLGIVSATIASGGDNAGRGVLAGLGFERNARLLSVFARTQWTTEFFAQLGNGELQDRPRQRSFGGFGLNLARYGSLQFLYGLESRWDALEVETVGLGYSLGLGTLGYLNLFASQRQSEQADTEVLLTWTVPFGERGSSSTALSYASDRPVGDSAFEAASSVQQNLPVGDGAGYRMELSTHDDYRVGYSYQGHAGIVSADYARHGGEDGWRAGAVGGLAITGAGVMPSRSLDQSFAVVQVADYEGVELRVANQPVARTDRRGRVLLDSLRPYEANQVSIDPTALPMDATLESATIEVTPAYRSGPLVKFPVTRADSVTLRLAQPDGSPVPAGARVTLHGQSFPVALEGLVYLKGASSRTTAIATWRDGSCTFEVERPASQEPVPDLGTVECHPRAAGAAP